MTSPTWAALAAALLLWCGPGPAARLAGLTGTRRLGCSPVGDGRDGGARSAHAWSAWRRVARIATALGCVAVAVSAGVSAGVVAAVLAGGGWLLARDLAARRRTQARAAQLTTALTVAVGELEAGASPADALAAAGATAPQFAAVLGRAAHAAHQGLDAGEVLSGEPDLRPLGVAWAVARDSGAALAGVVGRVLEDLRARAEQGRAVQVALSGPRSSAAVMAGLPVLGIGLGLAMGARPLAFVTGSTAGQAVGAAGVLLDGLGLLWMRRILRTAGGGAA